MVRDDHPNRARQASPDNDLDSGIVRAMVWQAIEYGRPAIRNLEAKIEPGSWVVVKPNCVYLRPTQSYRPGDITDPRVERAVLEYVEEGSEAGRITLGEGSSILGSDDLTNNRTGSQDGRQVGMFEFNWGPHEFPGFDGLIAGMLKRFSARYPLKRLTGST